MSATLSRKSVYLASFTTTVGLGLFYAYPYHRRQGPLGRCSQMSSAYEATFSVPITCDSCTNEISSALSKLNGLQEVHFSIPNKLVTTRGTEPPSKIVNAIESTGRAAILRGSGKPNSAAVCILETPLGSTPASKQPSPSSPVRGLLRLVELGDRLTMLDLVLTGMRKGTYKASVRVSGDISKGRANMGDVFTGLEEQKEGFIGDLPVDADGRGTLLGETNLRVGELVGRGVLVERSEDIQPRSDIVHEENELVVGVIARSAGTWENEKTVCSCTGKTVWEEREQMVGRGMV